MYTPIGEEFKFLDSIIVATISILIVFMVLVFIIVVSGLFSKIIVIVNDKRNINPRVENKILSEDEDAVVATLIASIDYYNVTKKNARVVSVTREED